MTDLETWQQVTVIAASAIAVVGALGSVMIRTGRAHIKSAVREEMDRQVGPIRLELRTMNGELARVRILEQKIENGLTERTGRIEHRQQGMDSKLDDILIHMAHWGDS